jgi:deoxyguanosine kinase
MPSPEYVAFEGPIAAGKTTLATLFAEHIGAKLVLEDFDGNEFLSDFYGDRDRWSLAMQASFLAARREQLNRLPKPFARPVVADYSHWKDGIFAGLLLQGRELRLFNRLDGICENSASPPNVIVYLDADNDVLLERIRIRGRPYEASIDCAYLDSLRKAYERALPLWGESKVMRYDTSSLDLSSAAQMNRLYNQIKNCGLPTVG